MITASCGTPAQNGDSATDAAASGTSGETDVTLSDETIAPTANPDAGADVNPDLVQNLGALLLIGDSAYEYYNFVLDLADKYINVINKAGEQLKGTSNVYNIVAPNSMGIVLKDSFTENLNTSDQRKALEYIGGSINPSLAKSIFVFDILKLHCDEYLYFRTDHHWTALGAYYAYTQFASEKGFKPADLSAFSELTFDGFLGSFYSQAGQRAEMKNNPDTITAYKPPYNIDVRMTNTTGEMLDWELISDVTDWDAGSKYSTFAAGDSPYTIIKNNDLENNLSCAVVKDSYGNAFIPFLTMHYQTVHVIDFRYWDGTLADFVKENKIDDVLFVNTISTTRNSSLISAMESLF